MSGQGCATLLCAGFLALGWGWGPGAWGECSHQVPAGHPVGTESIGMSDGAKEGAAGGMGSRAQEGVEKFGRRRWAQLGLERGPRSAHGHGCGPAECTRAPWDTLQSVPSQRCVFTGGV